jgi:predicted transposase YbfD/YdcC
VELYEADYVFSLSLRLRKKNAAQNMAIVRHIALNMLSNAKNALKILG